MKEEKLPASEVTAASGARCLPISTQTAAKFTPSVVLSQSGAISFVWIAFSPATQPRRFAAPAGAPPPPRRRAAPQKRTDDGGGLGGDAEVGAEAPADLVRVGPDLDQGKLRVGRGGGGVGLADAVGDALADGDRQVGLPHLVHQLLRHADAHIAAVVRVPGIEQLRPAMGGRDR